MVLHAGHDTKIMKISKFQKQSISFLNSKYAKFHISYIIIIILLSLVKIFIFKLIFF